MTPRVAPVQTDSGCEQWQCRPVHCCANMQGLVRHGLGSLRRVSYPLVTRSNQYPALGARLSLCVCRRPRVIVVSLNFQDLSPVNKWECILLMAAEHHHLRPRLCRTLIPMPSLQLTVRDALNSALDEEMVRDDSVFIIGEEVSSQW